MTQGHRFTSYRGCRAGKSKVKPARMPLIASINAFAALSIDSPASPSTRKKTSPRKKHQSSDHDATRDYVPAITTREDLVEPCNGPETATTVEPLDFVTLDSPARSSFCSFRTELKQAQPLSAQTTPTKKPQGLGIDLGVPIRTVKVRLSRAIGFSS